MCICVIEIQVKYEAAKLQRAMGECINNMVKSNHENIDECYDQIPQMKLISDLDKW